MKKILKATTSLFLAVLLLTNSLAPLAPVLTVKAATAISITNSNFMTNGYMNTTTPTTVNGHQQPYNWVSSISYGEQSYIPRVGNAVQIGSSEAGVTNLGGKLPMITTAFTVTANNSTPRVYKWSANIASKDGSEVGMIVKLSCTSYSAYVWGQYCKDEIRSNPVYREEFFKYLAAPAYLNGDGSGDGFCAANVGRDWYTTTSKTAVAVSGYIVVAPSTATTCVLSIAAREYEGNLLVSNIALEELTAGEINTLFGLGSGVVPGSCITDSSGSLVNSGVKAYTTANLQAAINSSNPSRVVQLLQNHSVSTLTANVSSLYLDLNGCMISGDSSNPVISVNSAYASGVAYSLILVGGGSIRNTSTGNALRINTSPSSSSFSAMAVLKPALPQTLCDSTTGAAVPGVYPTLYSAGGVAVHNYYSWLTIYEKTGIYSSAAYALVNQGETEVNGAYIGVRPVGVAAGTGQYAIHSTGTSSGTTLPSRLNIKDGIIGDPAVNTYAILNTMENAGNSNYPIIDITGGTIYGVQNGSSGSYGRKVTISGGDFYPATGGSSLYRGFSESGTTFSLTGGTYEKDYTSFCAAGYKFVSIGGGRFTIGQTYNVNVSVSGIPSGSMTLNSVKQPSVCGGDISLSNGTTVVSVFSEDIEELYVRNIPAGYNITATNCSSSRMEGGIFYFKPSTKNTTVTLTVAAPQRNLKITLGGNMTVTGGSLSQTVNNGAAISVITIKANDGYILPASLTLGSGLIYTRNTGGSNGDGKTAAISGNITGDVTATIGNAALAQATVKNADGAIIPYSTLKNAIDAVGTTGVTGNEITAPGNIIISDALTVDKIVNITANGTVVGASKTVTFGGGVTWNGNLFAIAASNQIRLHGNATVNTVISLSSNAYIAFTTAPVAGKTYKVCISFANGTKIVDGSATGNTAMTAADLGKFSLVDTAGVVQDGWGAYLDGKDIRIGEKYNVTIYNGSTELGFFSVIHGTPYGNTLSEISAPDGKVFSGWYTAQSGGERILPETIVDTKHTNLYARFIDDPENPVKVGANTYTGINAAVSANTGTFTVEILKDLNEYAGFEINGKNVTIDGGEHVVTFASITGSLITLSGGSNVTVKNTVFDGQNTARTGSIFRVNDSSALNLESGTVLRGNTINAADEGGAITIKGASAVVNLKEGSQITGNKAPSGGGIYVSAGTLNVNGGAISGNESTNRVYDETNRTAFHGDAVYIKGGTININGSKYNIQGDIYLESGETVNLTANMEYGKYAILTVTSSMGAEIITGVGAIESYGRVKLTNSGRTLAKGINTLDLTESTAIVAVLRASETDNEFTLGYTSVEAALEDIQKSVDGIVYIARTDTSKPGQVTSIPVEITESVPSAARLATADRVVSGYYGTVVTLQNYGTLKTINGLEVGIGNGEGDSLFVSLLLILKNKHDSVLDEITQNADYTQDVKTELIGRLALLYAQTSPLIMQSGTVAGQIELTKSGVEDIERFIDGNVRTVTVLSKSPEGAEMSENATVSPPSGFYYTGQEILLAAFPDKGYKFVEWREGEALLSYNQMYGYTVNGSVTLTAVFEEQRDIAEAGGVIYNTLAEAVEASEDGGIINVLKDLSEVGKDIDLLKGAYDMTLNLQSNTIEAKDVSISLGSGTVKNGTIDSETLNVTGGKLTLEYLDVTGGINIKDGAEVTIIGGGWFEGELNVEGAGKLVVKAGYFAYDPTPYLPTGYKVTLTAIGEKLYYQVGNLVNFTLSLTGGGLVYVDGTQRDAFSGKYAFGTSVTLLAQSQNNYVFSYWMDANGRAVSFNSMYRLPLVTDTEVTAVFNESLELTTHTVEYHNYNGTVLFRRILEVGTDFTPPANPLRYGHDFVKWDTEYNKIKTTHDDFIVKPIFKQNLNMFTVSVTGGTTANETNVELSLIEVTADTPEPGEQFSHWERDGKAVSYENPYIFILTENTSLTAVFLPSPDTPDGVLSISLTSGEGDLISFIVSRSIPSGYTVIEQGIILFDKDEEFDIQTEGVIYAKSVDKMRNGTFIVNKKNGTGYYARGYAVCAIGGEYFTFYSEITGSSK